ELVYRHRTVSTVGGEAEAMKQVHVDAAIAALQSALATFRDYHLVDDVYGRQVEITAAMEDGVTALTELRRLSQEHSDSFHLYSSASMSLMRAYQQAHGMLD